MSLNGRFQTTKDFLDGYISQPVVKKNEIYFSKNEFLKYCRIAFIYIYRVYNGLVGLSSLARPTHQRDVKFKKMAVDSKHMRKVIRKERSFNFETVL